MANGDNKTPAQQAQAAKDAADRQAQAAKDAVDRQAKIDEANAKRQADADAEKLADANRSSETLQPRPPTGNPLVDRPGAALTDGPQGSYIADPLADRRGPMTGDPRSDHRPDVVAQGDAEARQSQSATADRADPLRAVRRGDYAQTAAEPYEPDEEDAKKAEQLRSENRDIAKQVVSAQAARDKADAEYQALVNQQQLKNAELLRHVGQPARRPTNIVEYAAQAQRPSERYPRGEKLVNVFVPKGFQHRLDDHQLIQVLPGARKVPESMVDHWWFRANGVVAM